VNGIGRDRIEIAAALLLALAAVTTAWSSYQASRWNGEQAKTAGAVNKTRLEAARTADLATSQTQIDIATFVQWVDAYAQEQTELADFYRQRFRAEFKPAFEAWVATKPVQTPGAPPTPFAMPEYRLQATEDAERLDAEAEILAAKVRQSIQRSTNYVLGVVLCAVALFFAGISTKLGARGLRMGMVGLGWAIYLVALAWIATSPVSVAI
jgi:Domain of unknown function (DUF4337)